MVRSDISSAVGRTFWKAAVALVACSLLATLGCSKAAEEDVALPAWLTEDAPADGAAAEGQAVASNGTQPLGAPETSAFGQPQAFGQPDQAGNPQGGISSPQMIQGAAASYAATPQAASAANYGSSPSAFDAVSTGTQPSFGGSRMETAPTLDKAQLQLNLQVGMRLPLVKVIDTELTQDANNGLPEVHRSRLELSMIVAVEEQQQGQTRLSVQYNKIRLTRDAGGRRLEFDSSNPIVQTSGSPELTAYKAMVGDGFSYWISQENKVVGVVGFQEFMNRCLGHMPDAAQRAAMLGIEGSSGEDGLADFVDSTIGLLPYNSAKAVGERWSREVSIARPVPMRRKETYTLKDLNAVIAKVQVSAEIDPSTSLGHQMEMDGGVRIVIEGGSLTGQYEIFRDSGLPKQAETTESLKMVVQMAGGIEFRQTKRTTTTISAYPPQI